MLKRLRQALAEAIYPEGPKERRGLERQTLIDPFTGLGNKKALELALPLAEADPEISVLVFDLNNLGRANKVDGHKRGDALIRRAARTLQVVTKNLTGQCRAFRFGGDEFVVFCDKAYDSELIDALREGFGVHRLSDGVTVSLTGSFGSSFVEAEHRLQFFKGVDKKKDFELGYDER